MFFANLGLGEFLALFGAVSAGIVALYLLDRSRRKQVVATLRFWLPAETPVEARQRRKIQQPWSLALQILAVALWLLAIAQLKIGSHESTSRDHVLVLDTSAWMGARTSKGVLMNEARTLALSWLKTLGGSDRVMLVRADGVASPATRFESNRQVLEAAIRESRPGAAAFSLPQAVQMAQQLQRTQGSGRGEIVLITAGRTTGTEFTPPANLRVIGVLSPRANTGLRRMGLRRSLAEPDAWEVYVSVKNYGDQPRAVDLSISFGGAPAGAKRLNLAAGAEQEATFLQKTRASGVIEARLSPGDDFPQDDRASFELPPQRQLRVAVYSASPGDLKPLLAANPNVAATFAPPASYAANAGADLFIFDRFVPPQPPSADCVYIEPPAAQSPVRVSSEATKARLTAWAADALLGAGLRTRDLEIEKTAIFQTAAGDVAIAQTDRGAAIVARAGSRKIVVMGFHPTRSRLRFELATPLLFANVVRWMAPDSFRRWQLTGGHVGVVSVTLDGKVDPAQLKVLREDGRELPYTLENDSLRFFAGSPGTVRVLMGDREMVYSLTVPEVGDLVWQVPANVRRGLPARSPFGPAARETWPWLALAGALLLLIEWNLYGRHRARLVTAGPASEPGLWERLLRRRAS
jgi:hypothetical protein